MDKRHEQIFHKWRYKLALTHGIRFKLIHDRRNQTKTLVETQCFSFIRSAKIQRLDNVFMERHSDAVLTGRDLHGGEARMRYIQDTSTNTLTQQSHLQDFTVCDITSSYIKIHMQEPNHCCIICNHKILKTSMSEYVHTHTHTLKNTMQL